MPAKGGTLTLGDVNGDVFETITYGAQVEGLSSGRRPNATGDVVVLDHASPGSPNEVQEPGSAHLTEILIGPSGWIEWQAQSGLILDGWRLRTASHNPESWRFPAGASLDAGAFDTLALADTLPLDDTYAHWGVELVNSRGQVIDRVTWGLQLAGRSIGRLSDGCRTVAIKSQRSSPLLARPTEIKCRRNRDLPSGRPHTGCRTPMGMMTATG